MTTLLRTLRTALAGAALAACLAAALAAGLAVAPEPALAADPAPAASCVRGRDLFTPEEREAHRAKMAAATTPEEQEKLRTANQAELKKRAAAKKRPLCPRAGAPD